jgi:hypothetical protein
MMVSPHTRCSFVPLEQAKMHTVGLRSCAILKNFKVHGAKEKNLLPALRKKRIEDGYHRDIYLLAGTRSTEPVF